MIKEQIGIAATLEEARNMALKKLNAPIEADVKVEILETPKKKILGLFGGSDAKVKAFYDDGKKEPVKETKKEAPKKEAPKAEVKPEKKEAPKAEAKPGKKEAPKKAAPKPEAKQEKKEAPKKETKNNPEAKKAEPDVDLSGIEAKETDATNYLKSILVGMGFTDAGVTVKETGEDFYFEITCSEDYGNIIGRRGETLDALQYLTRLFVNRSVGEGKRVSLNVGDYRERRAETLKALAGRQAARALKIGRNSVLEPMNPYERRIIHTAIQEIEGVTSHSVGEGDNRRVVIVPENAKNQRGNRGGRNNYGKREKRAPYVPEVSDNREQKVDAAFSSRYGKIEPKKTVSDAKAEDAE